MAMTDAQKVISAQARAQARADAAAIEMKRVRAFLRMALPENAILPEPKRKQSSHQQRRNPAKANKPTQMSTAFIVGENCIKTACKCLAWEDCTCGKSSVA